MATVVKGLNLLRERQVLYSHPQRGYFVSDDVTQAPRVASRQIAFVTPSLGEDTDVYLRGMTRSLDEKGFTLATYSTHADLERYHDTLNRMAEIMPAGVILHSVPRDVVRLDDTQLVRWGIPTVLIGTPLPAMALDRVFVSGFDAGRKIALYTLQRGYTDVAALIEDPVDDEFRATMLDGLRSELHAGGVELTNDRVFHVQTPHGYMNPPDPVIDTRLFVAKLLKGGLCPRAIVCCHDYPAIGTRQAIVETGLKVPADIAVLSAHRCGAMGVDQMKLTTFDSRREEQARRAIDLLLRRIDGHTGPAEVHFVSGDVIEGDTARVLLCNPFISLCPLPIRRPLSRIGWTWATECSFISGRIRSRGWHGAMAVSPLIASRRPTWTPTSGRASRATRECATLC